MQSRAKLFGHAIHPILIVFPLGLLATAVVFDIIWLLSYIPSFAVVSYWMIIAGLVGGLVAAPFGTIDWFAIPSGTRAKTIGMLHGLTNVGVLLLFFLSWWFRQAYVPTTTALIFSFAGAGAALVGGWLGGELVERLGVGVDDGAHLDAPSSLSTSSAHAEVPVQDR